MVLVDQLLPSRVLKVGPKRRNLEIVRRPTDALLCMHFGWSKTSIWTSSRARLDQGFRDMVCTVFSLEKPIHGRISEQKNTPREGVGGERGGGGGTMANPRVPDEATTKKKCPHPAGLMNPITGSCVI